MTVAMTKIIKLKMTILIATTMIMMIMVIAMMMTLTLSNREGKKNVSPIDLKYFYLIPFSFFNT